MAKKPAKDQFDLLRERFTRAQDRWSDDRKRYKDDTHFLYVDHWPQGVRASRESTLNPRLCLEIDQLAQYQRQVINDSRQNRPQIKVRPVDSKADIETAEIWDGLCRHWQEASNADTCYDIALECSTGGGFGYFRILHGYINNNANSKSYDCSILDQDFAFAPVPNPLTVYYGEHKEPDGSDAKECWIVEEIPKDDYDKEYPNFKTTSWEGEGSRYTDWGGEKIRVAELYEIKTEDRLIHILEDGTVSSDEDYKKAVEEGLQPPAIKQSRNIPKKVLYWCKMNGAEFLEEPRIEPGDRIPVFPVWGNTQNIDGQVRHTSMIHKSKDAQLLYDYAQTAFAERVGQTPESSWVAAEGQIDPYAKEWDGSEWVASRTYTPKTLDGNLLPPPQRSDPIDIPAGFGQVMSQAEHGIQTTLGMYSASIGRKGNATSGVQEQEQARKGDVSTFHFHDNLARAIRSAGRYLISAAPSILDTSRVVRILGLDGQAKMTQLDPSQDAASQKVGPNSVFNLGVGTYDVAVDTGPSYQTSRQASAAGMLSLAQADPTMWQTHGDLIAEAQDWPEAQRFAKRSKLLLPPQVAAAESQDNQDGPKVMTPKGPVSIEEASHIIAQLEQNVQLAQQHIQSKEMETQQAKNLVAQTEAKRLELEQHKQASEQAKIAGEMQFREKEIVLDAAKVEIQKFEAETNRIQVESAMNVNHAEAETARLQAETELMNVQDVLNKAIGEAMQPIAESLVSNMQQHIQPVADAVLHAARLHSAKKVARRPDGSVIATSQIEE